MDGCHGYEGAGRHLNMEACTHKVDVPISISDLKWILVFEWCMVGWGSKNGHQKDICWKEIGLYVQNLLTILDVIVKRIWKNQPIWSFIDLKNLPLDNDYDTHRNSQNYEGSGYGHDLIILH